MHTPWTTGRSPSQCDAFRIIDFRLFFVFGWWPFKISTHVGASCTRFTTHHHITTAYHIRRKWKKKLYGKKGLIIWNLVLKVSFINYISFNNNKIIFFSCAYSVYFSCSSATVQSFMLGFHRCHIVICFFSGKSDVIRRHIYMARYGTTICGNTFMIWRLASYL